MSSPASSSDTKSSSFELLAAPVQRWIHTQGWADLRDGQEAAVPPILAGDTDVLIAGATASGKTEAAFLPICSALVAQPGSGGVEVLYLSRSRRLSTTSTRDLRACASTWTSRSPGGTAMSAAAPRSAW